MISIIIPNFNGSVHLETCFDSLLRQSIRNFSIILVDNNSTDDSVKFTRTNYPDVKIIQLDHNFGFSKTVNDGIKYSMEDPDNRFIVLLNNDVECKEDFIEQMVKGFINKETGSVACKMLNFDDHKIIDNAGLFMDLKDLPLLRGYKESDTGQYDKPEYIFGACAGAGIYRREVFENIGLFDEDFFAYHEDMDFNIRMQYYGYKCYYNPKAVCYHKGSSTSGSNSNFKIFLCEKNILLLRLKNYPVNVLISHSFFFFYYGAKRYIRYYLDGNLSNISSALKGFLKGINQSVSTIKKRKELKKIQKVSFKDIKFFPN